MKIPESLKLGGTIGFAAPSFGCNIEPYKTAFNNALKTFEKMGYKTKLGQNCYAGDGIGISNTPLKCAKEINSFLCGEYNEEISALFSCGGGELMCEILDDVDFDKIKKSKPVWFLGYSDNTVNSFEIVSRNGERKNIDNKLLAAGYDKIALKYEKNYPGIVRAIHKENGGHGSAVNTGLANATGLYFKVLDSDDWFDKESLVKVLDFLREIVTDSKQLDMTYP